MGLYSAMSAGVAGLNAQSAAMGTVADNITNVNTVGYKSTTADFRTMVGSGAGGGDYSAGGVSAVTRAQISKIGSTQSTNSNSDLAVAGHAFFVVSDDPSGNGSVAYTRAGSFTVDPNGLLRNTSGYYLLGWPTDAQGKYSNTGDLKALRPVNQTALTGTAAPSTKLTFQANLQSTTTAKTGYANGNLATGAQPADFARPVTVYDAQGGAHELNFAFIKTAPNTWQAEVYAQPASDVTAANGLVASGKVVFNGDGSLNQTASDAALFGSITPAWTNGAGASPIKLALGSDGGTDGLTQSSDASTVTLRQADGGLMGKVTDVNVSKDGLVSAVFANGTMRPIYQLPLATFPNADGLTAIQGNAYQLSDSSGAAAINPAGTQSASTVVSKALETSTADIATEFTNMIRFQRAYSASSKIITTVDQMLQELNELKR